MAFWRGRDSRRERLDLVKMSDKHPDIIDAELTAMFFFKKEICKSSNGLNVNKFDVRVKIEFFSVPIFV